MRLFALYHKRTKPFNFRHRASGDALQVPIKSCARIENALQLLLALGPDSHHSFSLAIEIDLHIGEFFDDRLDTMPKVWSCKILVDHFHFGSLTFLGSMAACQIAQ